MKSRILIVGAGFSGAVVAERLARVGGFSVLLIDKKCHVGGNAFDYFNDDGILIHKYGPHIFHTNSEKVYNYLSRFTDWRFYEHKVLSNVDNKLVPFPINIDTLNQIYDLRMRTDMDFDLFLKNVRLHVNEIRNSEDYVLSQVGEDLYKKFFYYYTIKQWDCPASNLDKSVISRIPFRPNFDDRYFDDLFQFMPKYGYTELFKSMLNHPNIEVGLNCDFKEIINRESFSHIVYTGQIDEFFDYRFGKLPYRSLKFDFQTIDSEVYQPAAVINYPGAGQPFTRITEYKYLTGQKHPKTTISIEEPIWDGDPYYPVPNPQNTLVYNQYKNLALGEKNVSFLGRLGTYRYYNMDQVVAQALKFSENFTERKVTTKKLIV